MMDSEALFTKAYHSSFHDQFLLLICNLVVLHQILHRLHRSLLIFTSILKAMADTEVAVSDDDSYS